MNKIDKPIVDNQTTFAECSVPFKTGPVEPIYPPVQARVVRTFDRKQVAWCWGESSDGWGSAFRHWIEVVFDDRDPIRGAPVGYDNIARLEDEGKTYVGFTAYYDGDLPIEQPMVLGAGQ